jgi:hypothetical protein
MTKADVQFNDVEGAAAADWHGADCGLLQLAAAAKIDIARFFPIGIVLHGLDLKLVKIRAIDTKGVCESTCSAVQEYIDQRPAGAVQGLEFDLDGPVEIASFMKRLEIGLASPGSNFETISFPLADES